VRFEAGRSTARHTAAHLHDATALAGWERGERGESGRVTLLGGLSYYTKHE